MDENFASSTYGRVIHQENLSVIHADIRLWKRIINGGKALRVRYYYGRRPVSAYVPRGGVRVRVAG